MFKSMTLVTGDGSSYFEETSSVDFFFDDIFQPNHTTINITPKQPPRKNKNKKPWEKVHDYPWHGNFKKFQAAMTAYVAKKSMNGFQYDKNSSGFTGNGSYRVVTKNHERRVQAIRDFYIND